MAGTITPVVCGKSMWYRLISIYTMAQIAGAALNGLLLGEIGILLRAALPWQNTPLIIPFGVVAAMSAVHDLGLLPFRLPSRSWQVPQSWKRFRPSVMSALFGFGIGLGVLTRIPFASFYLVVFACVGLASLPLALGIMVLYGATRAGTVALVAYGQAFAPDPHQRLRAFTGLSPLVGYLDGLVLAFAAGIFLVQSFLAG
jgi:hypothetical protein